MKNLKTTAKALTLLIFFGLSLFHAVRIQGQTQTQTPITANVNSAINGYYESLPVDYNQTSKKYPVIIFIHGLGEIGNGTSAQISKVLANGPPKIINQGKFPASFNVNGQNFSFIVISPQFNSNARSGPIVSSLIDYVVSRYRVDTDRIYLTGLSMGGGISWIYAGGSKAYSERIAALATVCGNTQPYTGNVNIISAAKLPVKIYHNEDDPTVPVSYSKNWASQLNAAGISPATQLTVWPSGGHDAWSKAYDPGYKENNQNVYEWMLNHKKGSVVTVPPPAPNQSPTANAGSNVSITLPTNSVTLSGNGADSDGNITGYLWSKISGPAGGNINTATGQQTVVNALQQGDYEFELTVTDNQGATGKARVKISVLPAPVANVNPIVNAGNGQTITLPANSVTISGSASDPDGSISSIQWTKISGPTNFSISNSSALQTAITGLTEGAYVFQLKVVDNNNASVTANVTITVNAATATVPPPITGGDCGCTMTLPVQPDGGIYISGDKVGAKPGNVICIKAGTYPYINLSNFAGTAAQPIIFRNCGGQVISAGKNYGVSITKSTHFKFDGTGDANVKYGFKIDGAPNNRTMANGLGISNQSSDFTVNNLEIVAVGGAGIMVKTNPTCDPVTWGGNFVMRNVVLHTIYVHDVKGEGFYVGSTSSKASITCDGTTTEVSTQPIENLKLYNCITEQTGWDGIQVANVPVNCQVYNNKVYNYGVENKSSQQGGLLFGGICNGKFYNNIVDKGTGNGIQVFGVGHIQGYNNLVTNAGFDGSAAKQDGIYVDDRPVAGFPALYITLANNTVVNPGRSGIRLENSNKSIVSVNKFTNNLIVAPGSTSGTEAYLSVRNGALSVASGNKYLANIADAGFVNATNANYHLNQNSQAVDAGISITDLAVTTDLDGLNRAVGANTDAGAYENQQGTVTVANKPPVAKAGSDISITLPVNQVSLNGSSSTDEDGNIVAYSWSKISGPATFTFANAASVSTAVTGLIQGSYQFELKVTDNKGATSTDQVSVTVNPAQNLAPTANAGNDATITLPVNSLTLRGSGSDADGSITNYSWTKVSGPANFNIVNPVNAETVLNSLVQGDYEFELKVTDNKGATAIDRVLVKVTAAVPVANILPVANAGNEATITLPVNSLTLYGKGSDADGTITNYSWTKVSGPANFNIVSPGNKETSVNNLVQGNYEFELTVTDNQGATAKSSVKVNVLALIQNLLPVVNAGPDQTITLPVNSVSVIASASDADGSISNVQWIKISGPAQYTITNDNGLKTDFSNLVAGVYVFEIKAYDNKSAFSADLITVNVVTNAAPVVKTSPVANAGSDITIKLPSNSVSLSGSNSSDNDGTITSYSWNKLSGPAATISSTSSASTSVSGLAQGIYEFQLTVADNDGLKSSDKVVVTVLAADPIPVSGLVSNAGADLVLTLPSNSITLNGNGSYASSGAKIVLYEWFKISGPAKYNFRAGRSMINPVINLVEGVYVFELKVTDNLGRTATNSVTVTILPAIITMATASTKPVIDYTAEILKLYPVPVNDILNFSYQSNNVQEQLIVTILDSRGSIVKRQTYSKTGNKYFDVIDVSTLKKGIYYFQLDSKKVSNLVKKFAKL